MKRYVKNKNFLPQKYIQNMNLEIEKRERIDCILMFILCMILLPNAIGVLRNKNKVSSYSSSIYKEKDNYKCNESRNESLNNAAKYINEIIEGDLSNGSGEIYIEGKNKLTEYINDEKITIDTIESLEDDKYRLKIDEE